MKLLLAFLFISLSVVLATAQTPQQCGENEAWFDCESSSRNDCGCAGIAKADCIIGCMCKNGYCRDSWSSPCKKRECAHPFYN
ncbi:hypothetical protein PVAND_017225 [Polypedilum vanderplanki]|uniref:TIL domain-containing protein n=1 Tax=Polypedilum vanderplanki TaxID=319348 RepID=A0A9J6BHG8_POLVA|nr:hypothetical protein PVAND_017225 [Polypedilum vanderplanki]